MTEPEGAARDPFDGLRLDESFIAAAAHREDSAATRVQARRDEEEARARAERGAARAARRSRRRRQGTVAAALLGTALAIGLVARHEPGVPPAAAAIGGDRTLVLDGEVRTFPTPGRGAEDEPLGTPAEVPADPGPYAFIREVDGRPVGYDPCRPLTIVVNDRTAPDGARDLVDAAVASLADRTGLRVTIEGPTDEAPIEARSPVQERYGDRWAPVLIAWSDPEEAEDLAGDVAGLGGSLAVPSPSGSGEAYVTGVVWLDGPQLAEILSRPDGPAAVQGVVEHELGHVVGLDHVDSETELMAREARAGISTYGPGDRAGLAQLGTGPCFPDL